MPGWHSAGMSKKQIFHAPTLRHVNIGARLNLIAGNQMTRDTPATGQGLAVADVGGD